MELLFGVCLLEDLCFVVTCWGELETQVSENRNRCSKMSFRIPLLEVNVLSKDIYLWLLVNSLMSAFREKHIHRLACLEPYNLPIKVMSLVNVNEKLRCIIASTRHKPFSTVACHVTTLLSWAQQPLSHFQSTIKHHSLSVLIPLDINSLLRLPVVHPCQSERKCCCTVSKLTDQPKYGR